MFKIWQAAKLLCLKTKFAPYFDPLLHNPESIDSMGQPFENIVGKGENAGNQHFLPFSQRFLHVHKQVKQ